MPACLQNNVLPKWTKHKNNSELIINWAFYFLYLIQQSSHKCFFVELINLKPIYVESINLLFFVLIERMVILASILCSATYNMYQKLIFKNLKLIIYSSYSLACCSLSLSFTSDTINHLYIFMDSFIFKSFDWPLKQVLYIVEYCYCYQR